MQYLQSVKIPNSVTNFGSYAFEYCYALETVTLGNGLEIIPEGTFFIVMD